MTTESVAQRQVAEHDDGIILSIHEGQWVATFTGPGEARIRELFGTNTIPTPFSAEVPASVVLLTVSHKNPTANVRVAALLQHKS